MVLFSVEQAAIDVCYVLSLALAEATGIAVHTAFFVDEGCLAARWTEIGADRRKGELHLHMPVGFFRCADRAVRWR